MPFSVDPQPGENEIECGRCGAIVYDQLSRCPNCGVNLFEPEDEEMFDTARRHEHPSQTWIGRLGVWLRGIFRKPYSAEEVFGVALDQGFFYNDLLQKVGGDHEVAERLIEFERQRQPGATRISWLKAAIERWQRDNRTPMDTEDSE